jgi:hypothetical protein
LGSGDRAALLAGLDGVWGECTLSEWLFPVVREFMGDDSDASDEIGCVMTGSREAMLGEPDSNAVSEKRDGDGTACSGGVAYCAAAAAAALFGVW